MSASYPIPQSSAPEPDHPLARAFASFTEAAGSLERSYAQLQAQVVHLRQELEVTNRDLAKSLEENRRIRERQRRILEGLPCGVLVMEAGGEAAILNPEGERLLDGQLVTNALPLSDALARARETGAEREVLMSAAPAETWLAVRHAWLEPDQSQSSSVYIVRDISEAKKLQREREQVERQQALVEMSALLAHEIRNPLGSLELFAGLLAETRLEGESQRWIEHVQAGLRTLSATVNNVLHLYNTPLAEMGEIDVGELLDWAHGFLLPLAKQAQVDMQLANGLRGVSLRADRHRLEQVLLNLALNAFRFMPAGGWLGFCGADLGANGIEIAVRDTGPGIVENDVTRIFQAGFSTRPGSCGLGLAVCQKIMEQHGGTIAVESRPGSGTTFRLRLPREVAQ